MTTPNKRKRRNISALRADLEATRKELLASDLGEAFAHFVKLQQDIAVLESAPEGAVYAGFRENQSAILFALRQFSSPVTRDELFEDLFEGGLPRARADGGRNVIDTTIRRLIRNGVILGSDMIGGEQLLWLPPEKQSK